MYIKERSLDDLMHVAFERLLKSRTLIHPRKGSAQEVVGAMLELTQPRARLSRTETKGTVFSCLGELLWYLSGTKALDFIQYYLSDYDQFSDDGATVHGAYGPRLFAPIEGKSQFDRVRDNLSSNRDTRQAVIQLFRAEDIIQAHKDVPCTCTIQFLLRDGHLHALAHMRSNDAYLGLPHDVFAFTMLQEIMARSIGAKLGVYKHAVGSLHLYRSDVAAAEKFLKEGWQGDVLMPEMPSGDPWHAIDLVKTSEAALRSGAALPDLSGLPPYWMDLVRLLEIFAISKSSGALRDVVLLKRAMSSPIYDEYIRKREARLKPAGPGQLSLLNP